MCDITAHHHTLKISPTASLTLTQTTIAPHLPTSTTYKSCPRPAPTYTVKNHPDRHPIHHPKHEAANEPHPIWRRMAQRKANKMRTMKNQVGMRRVNGK